MESIQCLQATDSPFELRMKGDLDADFADISCDIEAENNDLAAQQLLLQLQMLREENLKRYGGERKSEDIEKKEQKYSNLIVQPLAEDCSKKVSQSPRYGQASSVDFGDQQMAESKSSLRHAKSTSLRKNEAITKASSADETMEVNTLSETKVNKNCSSSHTIPLSPVALDRPTSHKGFQNPYTSSPPTKETSPIKDCSPNYLGIGQSNYEYSCNEENPDVPLPFVLTGFNIPPPLYGHDWGDEPCLSDYDYPEILSVIEEVDIEDDDNSEMDVVEQSESERKGDKKEDEKVEDFGLCNCDLYISEEGIKIIKNPSICSDVSDEESSHLASEYDVFRKPNNDYCLDDLKHLSPASTAEETESSDGNDSEDFYDEFYKEENCLFFLDGCLSLFSRHFMKRKQPCLITTTPS